MRGEGLSLINVLFPLAGIGLMVFYEACDTSCAYLQGTFAGVDLKVFGVVFMDALLALIAFDSSRFSIPAGHVAPRRSGKIHKETDLFGESAMQAASSI